MSSSKRGRTHTSEEGRTSGEAPHRNPSPIRSRPPRNRSLTTSDIHSVAKSSSTSQHYRRHNEGAETASFNQLRRTFVPQKAPMQPISMNDVGVSFLRTQTEGNDSRPTRTNSEIYNDSTNALQQSTQEQIASYAPYHIPSESPTSILPVDQSAANFSYPVNFWPQGPLHSTVENDTLALWSQAPNGFE